MVKTKIAFNLNKDLNCEYVCTQIQLLINNFTSNNNDIKNYSLVLELKEIIDSNQYLLPRIEYKHE